MPSDDEISAVEELVSVLDVFNSAIEIVSGEKYPTLGIVLPLLSKLLSHTLAEVESDKRLTKRIKTAIREDLMYQYQDKLVKMKLSIAAYLDPRFKALSVWRGIRYWQESNWLSLRLLMQTNTTSKFLKVLQNQNLMNCHPKRGSWLKFLRT